MALTGLNQVSLTCHSVILGLNHLVINKKCTVQDHIILCVQIDGGMLRNKARTSIVYFTWVDARGGSRKFLNGCNRSSGMRARTTPTFSSETKALRVIGAWLLTNLAPLSPLSPPLIRDFLKRQVGSEVRGPQKFYLMKKLIAHLGLVQ